MANAQSMKPLALASVLALVMVTTALAPSAVSLSANAKRAEPTFVLEQLVPSSFPGWRIVRHESAQVVNPQEKRLLDKLYSQQLTRAYASDDGYIIMLSIAYGDEQRGDLEVHRPHVCYPAQGFTITERRRAAISTDGGKVNVERFEAQQGTRVEPITYWIRIGEQNITDVSLFGRRLEDLRFALNGRVPDGLLFRVSSIDTQRERAFARQDQFVSDLLGSVGPSGRSNLVGTR